MAGNQKKPLATVPLDALVMNGLSLNTSDNKSYYYTNVSLGRSCFIAASSADGRLDTSNKMPKPNTDIEARVGHALMHDNEAIMQSSKTAPQERGMDDFVRSIKLDAASAEAMVRCLDLEAAKSFIQIIEKCDGTLITSGIGKSGIVAERMAASLSSTGTPAHYVHGAEWTHGDLGKARRGDVCVFFSHSGNTRECVFAATILRDRGVHILSIIGNPDSTLAKVSDAFITYKTDVPLQEPIGGVPTTSVMLQEMVVNAVVTEMIIRRRFTCVEFARNHPGGSLGQKLCGKDSK